MQSNGVSVTPLTNWPSSGRGRGFAPGRGRGLSWSSGGEERPVGASRHLDPSPDKSDRHCFQCWGLGHLSRQCPSHPRRRKAQQMMIPGMLIDRIIGKGGECIKAMQEESRARIVIIQQSKE